MLTASDYRAKAREALKGNWGIAVGTAFAVQAISIVLVAIAIIILFASGLSNLNEAYTYGEPTFSTTGILIYLIMIIVALFVSYTLSIGFNYFTLNLVRGNEFKFDNIFSRFNKIFKIFGLYFMMGLFIWLWSILFLIPGIIACYRYIMAPYIMAEDPEVGIMEAIGKSKELMKGYKWKFFCLEISFIGWILLSFLTAYIGLLWVVPYMQTSYAAFYLEVSGQSGQGGQKTQYEYDLSDE